MATPLSILQKDIEEADISLSISQLRACLGDFKEEMYQPKDVISRRRVDGDFPISSQYMLYLTSGITAAEITGNEGQRVIPRFHEPGDISAPLPKLIPKVSQCAGIIGDDSSIIAITPVKGLLIPLENWHREYLRGGAFGEFVRYKMFEGYQFNAAISHVKSLNRTAESYNFLRTYQPNILKNVPQKIIARFIGITPEGLSRFLKNTAAA